MFSFSFGRRNVGGNERGDNYAMVPVGRNVRNPLNGDRNNDEDEFNDSGANPSATTVDFDGDINDNAEENQQRRTFTRSAVEQEQIRRQQILRLGLLACLVLFLMDGSSYSNANPESHSGNNTSKRIDESLDEIRLSSKDLFEAKSVLLPLRPSDFTHSNATGVFKGAWQTYNSYYSSNNHYNEFLSPYSSNNTYSMEEGSLIITLKTIPIRDLPDLSFTYGLARTYNKNLRLVNDMSFPIQGVLFTAEKKLLMFSTPYKSQKLMLQFTTPSTESTTTNSPSASPTITDANNPTVRLLKTSIGGDKSINSDAEVVTHCNYDLQTTTGDGISFRISGPSATTSSSTMNLFIWDSAISNFNTTAWTNNHTRTLVLGEKQLSTRFHYFQSTRPPINPLFVSPSFLRSHAMSINRDSSTNFPSANHIETPANLASDCFYALDIDLADHKLDVSRVIEQDTSAQVHNEPIEHRSLKNEDHLKYASSSEDIEEDMNYHRNLGSIIPSTENLHGAVQGFFSCSKTFMLSVSSYQIEYDALKSKIEIYSFIYTTFCLVQVVFVIYQIRFSSTQALSSRLSITAILAQSVLDAVICMGHLLLGAGLSDLFFTSFIWISVLKLLLFSVFQMRLVINAYQARFAQEISLEGLRGLRSRLVTMHIRFYGIVMLILIIGFSIPIHPMIIIIGLYSFWWPQIIHNVQQGTKHSLHPVYLYGLSVSRLFLPFYLMGCPRNFLVGLWEYFSPSGHLAPGSMLLSPAACYFLVMWMALQVLLLHMQSVFGPRFFVPKRFLPQRYDYHRPLPPSVRANFGLAPAVVPTASSNHLSGTSDAASDDGDLETGALLRATSAPVGSGVELSPFGTANTTNSSGSDIIAANTTNNTLECVICYNSIDAQGCNNSYMITPCDHVFHEECLQQWLRVKLECPVCRARCPPTDEDNIDESS